MTAPSSERSNGARKSSFYAPSLAASCLEKPVEMEGLEAAMEQLRASGEYTGAARVQRRLSQLKEDEERRQLQVPRRTAQLWTPCIHRLIASKGRCRLVTASHHAGAGGAPGGRPAGPGEGAAAGV